MALFIALNQAQLIALPFNPEWLGSRLILAGTLTNDQINMLTHAIGTTTPFTVNKCLML